MRFPPRILSLPIIHLAWCLATPLDAQESVVTPGRILLGDSGLILQLPTGWHPAEKQPGHEDSLGAFQSKDNTSSVFITKARASPQADMNQVMEGVITNFESAFILREVGKLKEGKLAGSPAVFTTLDADLRAKNGPDSMPFRFYLAVLDTGKGLYLFQGSIQLPLKKEREQEILTLLRSLAKIGSAP